MRTRESIHRKRSPFFGPERFTYEPENNRYICPAGQPLNYGGWVHRNRAYNYIGPVLAPTTMHQRCLPGPHHPPKRTSPTTCAGVGQHARVRQSTTAKKEGGSLVRGTEESDRIAALAFAQTEVRAGAVLPGSGGPEHQTTSPVPQSTDNTDYGSRRLAEVKRNTGLQGYGQEFLPITDFFNTHGIYQQLVHVNHFRPTSRRRITIRIRTF